MHHLMSGPLFACSGAFCSMVIIMRSRLGFRQLSHGPCRRMETALYSVPGSGLISMLLASPKWAATPYAHRPGSCMSSSRLT